MNGIRKLEVIIVIMVHELMKESVDESLDFARNPVMFVVPKVDMLVAI
jgi:hypothetical protein